MCVYMYSMGVYTYTLILVICVRLLLPVCLSVRKNRILSPEKSLTCRKKKSQYREELIYRLRALVKDVPTISHLGVKTQLDNQMHVGK